MSQPNKPSDKGFKPGANMPSEGYDPKRQGMSQSGNHATGDVANDTPGNLQQVPKEDAPAQSEHALRQDNQNRENLRNKQSAADASTAATRRDQNAGARGDSYTDNNRSDKS